MKILITGAGGMLGSDWIYYFKKNNKNVIGLKREDLDITKLENVRIIFEKYMPDIVIHTAAHTDVNEGEILKDISYKINFLGTWNIALLCQEYNKSLVYISSCGIFDGKKVDPYNELDIPNPLTHHHKSKYKAEEIISKLVNKFFIFRPGWLFGGSFNHKKNFVANRYKEALNKKYIKSNTGQKGSPTYTLDFIKMADKIILKKAYGLYHIVNTPSCTRYEYVKACINSFKLETKVLKSNPEDFKRKANVALSESLENYFLKLRGFPEMRRWEIALEEYIQDRLIPELNSYND